MFGLRFLAPFLIAACAIAQPPADPVENAPDYTPLTGSQRWQRYGREAVRSPLFYMAVFGSAGLHQLTNDPPEWHQGLKGYSRRLAGQFGVYSLQIGIHEAAAAALHYEPRYIQSGRHGVLPRLGHAVKWTFITYDSDRRKRFDIPAVAAAYSSSMIATSWYPARYSVLHDGVRAGNQQLAFAVGVSIIREFAPELRRLTHLKL